MMAPQPVGCCFCGIALSEEDSVRLVIYPPKAREEAQTMYCHPRCLVARVSPDTPLHPDLVDEEEAGGGSR